MQPDLKNKYPETSFSVKLDEALYPFLPNGINQCTIVGHICTVESRLQSSQTPIYPPMPWMRHGTDEDGRSYAYGNAAPQMCMPCGSDVIINYRVYRHDIDSRSMGALRMDDQEVKGLFRVITDIITENACEIKIAILPMLQLEVGPLEGYFFKLRGLGMDISMWKQFLDNPIQWLTVTTNMGGIPGIYNRNALGREFTMEMFRVEQKAQPKPPQDPNKETIDWYNRYWGRKVGHQLAPNGNWDYGQYVDHFAPVQPVASQGTVLMEPQEMSLFTSIATQALTQVEHILDPTFPWNNFLEALTVNQNAELRKAWTNAKQKAMDTIGSLRHEHILTCMINILLEGAKKFIDPLRNTKTTEDWKNQFEQGKQDPFKGVVDAARAQAETSTGEKSIMDQAMQDVAASYDPTQKAPTLDDAQVTDIAAEADKTQRIRAQADMDANLSVMRDQINQMAAQQKRILEEESKVTEEVVQTAEDVKEITPSSDDGYFEEALKDDDDLAKPQDQKPEGE